jgi:hypothetical protein
MMGDLLWAARCLRVVFWLMVIFGFLFAVGFFVLLAIMVLGGLIT